MGGEITPFRIAVTDAELVDLRERLRRTRWPDAETVDDWSQGVPLDCLRQLCAYWAEGYDWRATEARLNGFPQYRTEIDGLGIHFLHVRSPRPDALPLILTHGWPGSVAEFGKVIGPLTEEFHVVCPSLPGYGFSDKPSQTGWTIQRIASAWAVLMARLVMTATAPRVATGGPASRRRWPSRTPRTWWGSTSTRRSPPRTRRRSMTSRTRSETRSPR